MVTLAGVAPARWRVADPAGMDMRAAGGAAAALGGGTVVALAGAASGSMELTLVGAAAAGAALFVLLSGGWIDALLLVALSAPLPAVWSGDGVRVAAAVPVALAAAGGWIVQRGTLPSAVGRSQLPLRLLAAFGLALVVATVASPTPALAARELVNVLLLLLLLLAMTERMLADPAARARVATVLAGLAVLCGGLALLEAVGVLPGEFPRWDTPYYRAALGFGQPNGLGLFLAITLPLVVWRATASTSAHRGWWRAGAALAALGMLATFSRGSWSALIAGAGAFALARQWRTAARVVLGMLAAAIALDLVSGGMVRDTFTRTLTDWVVEQRAALTWAGILMFLDHPLLGVGPGGFEAQLDFYGIFVPGLFDFQPTPHNAYVQMAAEAGIGGLVVYLMLIGAFVRLAAQRVRSGAGDGGGAGLDRALLWSMGSLAVSGLFLWPLAHGTGEVVVLLMALVATSARAP